MWIATVSDLPLAAYADAPEWQRDNKSKKGNNSVCACLSLRVVPASVDEEGNIHSLDPHASRNVREKFEEAPMFLS
jgi:hypothetical protein